MLVLLPPALVLYAYAPVLPRLGGRAALRRRAVPRRALELLHDLAAARAAHLRGRVLAVNNVILGSLYPLGAVVQGKIADSIGLRATTAGAAVLMAAALLAVRVARPRITARARRASTAGRRSSSLTTPAPAPSRFRAHGSRGDGTQGLDRVVTLNRPEARNAISPEVSETMVGILDEIEADDDAPRGRAHRRRARCSRPAPTSRSSRRAARPTSRA